MCYGDIMPWIRLPLSDGWTLIHWLIQWLTVVVNSVTDLLTSSPAAHPEIFTLTLVDSTHIVGPFYAPTLLHLHNSSNANETTLNDMGI